MGESKKPPAADQLQPVDQLQPSEGCTVEPEDDGDLKALADPAGAVVPEPWDDPDDDEEGADRG